MHTLFLLQFSFCPPTTTVYVYKKRCITIDINVDNQTNYVQDDNKSSTITRIAQLNSNKKPQLVKLIKKGKQT